MTINNTVGTTVGTVEDTLETPTGARHALTSTVLAPQRDPHDSWLGLLLRPAAWVPIIALQIALALRVAGPISTDEATYLVAGHQLLAHMFSGASVNDYGTYFSGVPGLYPVFASAVDHVAGLTGVRFVSLICMLVVSVCLYLVTARLFGRTSAFFAALVFAIGSGASFLGWYATFDAPALALLAVATLLAYQSSEHPSKRRLIAIGAVLVVAVGVKYVSVEYVPAILAILALRCLRHHGWKLATKQTAIVVLVGVLGTAVAAVTMSSSNWDGFTATSSSGRRVLQSDGRLNLLGLSWSYIGMWMLLSLVGLVVLFRQRRFRWESVLLFATGLLPVLTHVILGEATSMHKHTTFGFFFAAPLAGYAIASAFSHGRHDAPLINGLTGEYFPVDPDRPKHQTRLRRITGVIAPVAVAVWMIVMLSTGMASATAMKYGWPNNDAVTAAIRPYVNSTGHYLSDNSSIPNYFFQAGTQPSQWTSPWFFGYLINHQLVYGDRALAQAVSDQYFNLIVYRPVTFTPSQTALLQPLIAERYKLVDTIGYGNGQAWSVWIPKK